MKSEMDRRTFIKHAARSAAVASLGASGPFLRGCRTGRDYDLLVKDELIFDGQRRSLFRTDIGVSGDSIADIGKIGNRRGKTVICARDRPPSGKDPKEKGLMD
jgi:hypothetical protein